MYKLNRRGKRLYDYYLQKCNRQRLQPLEITSWVLLQLDLMHNDITQDEKNIVRIGSKPIAYYMEE